MAIINSYVKLPEGNKFHILLGTSMNVCSIFKSSWIILPNDRQTKRVETG